MDRLTSAIPFRTSSDAIDLPLESQIYRSSVFASKNFVGGLFSMSRVVKETIEGAASGGASEPDFKASAKEVFGGFKASFQGKKTHLDSLPAEDFVNAPLQDNENSIRLIKILSATDSSHLRLSVQEYAPSETPPYVALSYVWMDYGPMPSRSRDFRPAEQDVPSFSYEDEVDIIINDRKLSVKANLHAALRGLNTHLNGRPIWTDAICIDQTNMVEKGAQVQRMGRTYADAAEVFVWLGRKHGARSNGLHTLRNWPTFPSTPDAAVTYRGKKYPSAKAFYDKTILDVDIINWMKIAGLVAEGWWSRSWTVQEFILSRQHTFFYNGDVVDSDLLENAVKWTKFLASNAPSTLVPSWVSIQPSLFDLKSRPKIDVLQAALLGATRMATDPRDKVYAYLAISDLNFKPAYGDYSVGALYHNLAKQLLASEAGLLTLSLVHHPTPESKAPLPTKKKPIGNRLTDAHLAKKRLEPKNPDAKPPPSDDILLPEIQPDWSGQTVNFPSWVPKLSGSVALEPFFLRERRALGNTDRPMHDPACRIFNASETSKNDVSMSEDGLSLSVSVAVISQVASAHTLPQPGSEKSEAVFYKDLRKSLPKEPLASIPYNKTNEMASQALWRTLIGNIWLAKHPAPDGVEGYFASFAAAACNSPRDVRRDFGLKKKPDPEDRDIFSFAMSDASTMPRTFFTTSSGLMGLGPPRAARDDVVALIAGAHVPFVLRETVAGKYLLIGEAYVHGAMHGEYAASTFVKAEIV